MELQIDDLLKKLFKERYNYKGLSILKNLLITDTKFTKIFLEALKNKTIIPFEEQEFALIKNQNIRGIDNFETVFKEGLNIGRCTVTSKQLSYSYDGADLVSGIMINLKGTENSINGEHSWLEYNNYIYDTTLMIKIDKSLKKLLGYQEENRITYDTLNQNPLYRAAKDYTNDKEIKPFSTRY